MKIWTVKRRKCGVPKAGGLYILSAGTWRPCGKFPFAVPGCEHCAALGIPCRFEYSRAPRVADLDKLLAHAPTCRSSFGPCIMGFCPASDDVEVGTGLLYWVGSKYYTSQDYVTELADQGASWRVPHFPKGIVVGESYAIAAHARAIVNGDWRVGDDVDEQASPGAIAMFRIAAVYYVVKDDDDDDKLARLEKSSITPVKVEVRGSQ